MKKIITCLAISITVLAGQSCNNKKAATNSDAIATDKVPASVQAAFTDKYAGVTAVQWEDAHEGDRQSYKAKFVLDGKKWKAEFDANGVLIKEKEDD